MIDIASLTARTPDWSDEFANGVDPKEWDRGHRHAPNTMFKRITPNPGERALFTDKALLGRDTIYPLNGTILIQGERMDAATRAKIAALVAKEQLPESVKDTIRARDWLSGLLVGKRSFQYGYFEARIKNDGNASGWPAFWLLGDKTWPPEIDVVEIPGDGTCYQTLHTGKDTYPRPNATTPLTDPTAWHTYGLLWSAEMISFVLDGKVMATFPTPPDMKQPMYLLLNLSIGGWKCRVPDETTKPPRMQVDYVRVWSL